jgi:hypothetical protein
MLAKLFTLIVPVGDIAYRVNMFSALCAALGLMVLRRLASTITGSDSAALLATALLGASYPFWSEAVVAEVYILHILFLGSILWLALRWRATGRAGFLVSLGLVTGLSFGNHMSTILFLPGLAILIWSSLRRHEVTAPALRVWLMAGFAFSAALLTYLYLPLRYAARPALNYAMVTGLDLSTPAGMFSMVRGEMFGYLMFAYDLAQIPQETWRFLQLLWQTFFGIGSLVAAVGLWEMWKRDRPLALTLGVIFATNAIFYVNYRVFDKDTMFLPVFLVLSLWMAQGLQGLQERLADSRSQAVIPWGVGVVVIVMLILNYPRVDLSHNLITRKYAEEVFQQAPVGAFISGEWIDITPLEYLQVVEGRRPDVTLFDYGLYSLGRMAALKAHGLSQEDIWRIPQEEIRQMVTDQLSNGRPVFSLEENPILKPAFNVQPFTKWLYTVTSGTYERLRPE